MKKYEVLEHKGDLKIRVWAGDLKGLFLNCLIGMYKAARYQGEGKLLKRKIKISSSELPSLLVDFLSEVLYLTEVYQEVYRKIEFKKFNEKNLEGILTGEKLKRMGVQIKAVTYHGLEIKQKKDGRWEAAVLFDI